jgi:UPF0716 protein FxsA
MRISLLPLLLFPFLELWLMIVIGDEAGAWAVILWLVAMIVIGMNLLRYLGAASLLKVAQNMHAGEFPAETIADGVLKAIGAVLLIIPGFITDAIALLCFIPLFRRLLLRRWVTRMSIRTAGFAQRQPPFGPDPFGDGKVYEHDGGAARSGGNQSTEGLLIEQGKTKPASNDSPSGPANR